MRASTRQNVASAPSGIIEGPALIAVVDDDHDVRQSLAELLEDSGFDVRAFAGAFEYLSAPSSFDPCCLLLDVRLHGMSGLDLQDRLLQMGSRTPIVFMSGNADVSTTVRAMKGGAFDFLQKPFREQEVLDAVFHAERAYQQRAEVARTAAMIDARFDTLTVREREVLSGVVEGLLNKQIAAELGISEITVKVHRANLMKKMKVRSLVDLVKQASLRAMCEPATANCRMSASIPSIMLGREQPLMGVIA